MKIREEVWEIRGVEVREIKGNKRRGSRSVGYEGRESGDNEINEGRRSEGKL